MTRKLNTIKHAYYCLFFSLAFLTFSCNHGLNEESNNATIDDYAAQIDSLITSAHPRIFNGVVHISKGGDTKYLKEYGYSDFEKKTAISVHDQFRIMSNSKQITAALIMKLVEAGKINLEHTLAHYLPDFSTKWREPITIHQLLNMSSGIADFDQPLLFKPGTGYHYSNPGYGLLGRIIEKVSSQTFIENAHSLFAELGMKNTYCYELDKPQPGLITGHWLKNGDLTPVQFDSMGFSKEEWKDFIPAGGMISNIRDLHIWDDKLHKGKIVGSDYLKLMVSSSNRGPHAAFDNDTLGYGYGIRIHDSHPTLHLGHGGRGFGFASIKFYIPEKDIDVIIWENVYSRDSNWLSGDLVYLFENEIRKIILSSSLVDDHVAKRSGDDAPHLE